MKLNLFDICTIVLTFAVAGVSIATINYIVTITNEEKEEMLRRIVRQEFRDILKGKKQL